MKVLHIIRRKVDRLIEEIIDHDSTVAKKVSVLLIQDGVLSSLRGELDVFASTNDVIARGITVQYNLIDYPAACRLIIEHDKVVVW